jgi:hypothetical protein
MAKVVNYKVAGKMMFPVDMLRYDGSYPRTETDSGVIESTGGGDMPEGGHVVELQGYQRPSIARWKSFGWRVVEIDGVKA